MFINKLKIKNFKKYHGIHEFSFAKGTNILVGDNESGKTTLLEALEMVLNNRIHGHSLNQSITTDLFNQNALRKFIESEKSINHLPEILIEAYLEDVTDFTEEAKLRGSQNSDNLDTTGVFLRICFNPDLDAAYNDFIENNPDLKTLPIEFYHVEWFGFDWKQIHHLSTNFRCIAIDPTRIHPSYGRHQYIRATLGAIGAREIGTLNLSFRQLQAVFADQNGVKEINSNLDSDDEITEKDLSVVADISSSNSWERNLQLAVDGIRFEHIGKGEQTQILLMLALSNKLKDTPFVLIEEPENHLSHLNLIKSIERIEKHGSGKQLFLTTHSSYVLNKLNLANVSVLGDAPKRLDSIDPSTAKRLKRMPGYDTLRVVLAKKVILVEGPSDELLLKKKYLSLHSVLPEKHGIDIIVVRGIGFRNYLNVGCKVGNQIHVVKDNDGDYMTKVQALIDEYSGSPKIKFFSEKNDKLNSLEPALFDANGKSEDMLDGYAKLALSTQTYKKYEKESGYDSKVHFLKSWFVDSGNRKVDSAIRIFESDDCIEYPKYMEDALQFDA